MEEEVKKRDQKIDVLDKALEAKRKGEPVRLSEIRKQIYDWYAECVNDYSLDPKRFEKLKGKCLLYSALDPKASTAFLRHVKRLLEWMEAAEKGAIQILPKKFEESAQWGWSHYNSIVMKYRFSQGDKKCESWKCYVDKKENLWGNPERYPHLTVPWVPGGGKLVIEAAQLEGEEEAKKGKAAWSMTGYIIHKSDDELLKLQELKTKDPDYRFYYTIRRKGFGPIPKLPVPAGN